MDTLATLLHERDCPFDYQCLSTDCIECVKLRMEEMMDNRCVCCGEIIQEGRMVCPTCERMVEDGK